MNTVVTSKESILKCSRDIIIKKGVSALSIRAVAAQARICVGSVYNYFSSKSDLLCATVENIWMDIFEHSGSDVSFRDTGELIVWIFGCLEYGRRQYPGFLEGHAFIFPAEEKADGAAAMKKVRTHILLRFSAVLEADPQIREDAFSSSYTPQRCAEMLFSMIVSSALHGEFDPYMVLETVRRALY